MWLLSRQNQRGDGGREKDENEATNRTRKESTEKLLYSEQKFGKSLKINFEMNVTVRTLMGILFEETSHLYPKV